ncbi:MAG: DNA topoisomerase 1 [Lentisphaerae bacterium ADurb.BinA184]|nr:MAG: DNA topoisomerase 1 [Lentisphaerae bacterium ADurb.BinA184]
MSKRVVIVESPTKARTITRFLGGEAEVLACMGHVRDLPENKLGVDIANHFAPTYQLTTSGKRTLGRLKSAVAGAEEVFLATDPDREGEAIAWHLHELLARATRGQFRRATFHEITRPAIARAFAETGQLDMHLVDAQQARRILDRLVGYKVSPLLWKSVRKGTSAGRVQSVALRLICEREREIRRFVPQEYWNLIATFVPEGGPRPFDAKLNKLDGKKPEVPNAEVAEALARDLEGAAFRVAAQGRQEKSQRAPPPFITSTLQQAAGNNLRFTTRQTMEVAQQLYEGVELGSAGATGLITYMRTDSPAVAQEAQQAALEYIRQRYGAEFVPDKPNVYKSRQSAQAAHEAIRPTDVTRTPETMAAHLSPVQLRLYRLIWNRFVASQMAPARLVEHTIDVASQGQAATHEYLFRASSVTPVFPGYLTVYQQKDNGDEMAEDNRAAALPEVRDGQPCQLEKLDRKQLFTEPPKRFSEASLVRELEQNGVGRPSTYAAIVQTIQQRLYVKREKAFLVPTDLGFAVNDYLVGNLPDLFQVGFTAEMETQLDRVEEGALDLTGMLDAFYQRFREWVPAGEALAAPADPRVRELLAVFPDGVRWSEPTKRRGRSFDDGRFFESLKKQVAGGKPLSDKQWQALLGLAGRYSDQIPGLAAAAERLGITRDLEAVIAARRQREAERAAAPAPTGESSTQAAALLEALAGVAFDPPRKRGRRTYDDREFVASLRKQAETGRPLSPAQLKALGNLFTRYRDKIAGFDEVAARCGLAAPAAGPSADAVPAAEVEPLLPLLDAIQTWEAPRQARSRTFDDKAFADSIRRQFTTRKSLSRRQVGALGKLLARYHGQIPDYRTTAAELPPAPTEPCPECGAPLAVRRGRRGPFYGCSAYPKCRFTKPVSGGK